MSKLVIMGTVEVAPEKGDQVSIGVQSGPPIGIQQGPLRFAF
jgi:hypothetical protein